MEPETIIMVVWMNVPDAHSLTYLSARSLVDGMVLGRIRNYGFDGESVSLGLDLEVSKAIVKPRGSLPAYG